MSRSSKTIKTAIALRKSGYLYSKISEVLKVPKSTVYGWTKDVRMTEAQRLVVASKLRKSQLQRIQNLAVSNKMLRVERDRRLLAIAEDIVASANLNNANKQLLCSILYWAEGGKDISGGPRFINSDPIMISTFLNLLRESFDLNEDKFRALIHLHEYHDALSQLSYWSGITKIPVDQFHKSYLKPNTGKSKHDGYAGCVSIRYMDRNVGKLLQMIYTKFGSKYRGVR